MNKPDWEGRPIKNLLEEKLTIPPYQRGYAWEEDEVGDFLEDFFEHIKSKNEYYLFGQIILHVRKEPTEENAQYIDIIDGQQRMATSVMFLSVLRDILKEISNSCDRGIETEKNLQEVIDEYIVDNFDKKYVGEVKKKGGTSFNLTLSGVNQQYFLEHVQKTVDRTTPKRDENPSNKKISKACSLIYKMVKEELAGCGNNLHELFNKIESFFRRFTEEFYVCKITTWDAGQAYVIFETINSRGKDLEAADLLKNYFLAIKRTDPGLAEKWVKMVNNITPSGKPTQFIRYYWNSKYNFVREKDLFYEVKRKTTNSWDVDIFLDELFRSVEVYLFLRSPEDNRSVFETDELGDRILTLKRIGAQSFYPLIISAVRNKVKEQQILGMIKGIESLVIRNITIGGENPNQYERFFNDLSLCLQKNGEAAVKEITQKIMDKIMGDSIFRERFRQYEPKADKTFVILKRLYSSEYAGLEMEIKSSRKDVNVEHIMPVDIKEWDLSFEPEQLAEWGCKTSDEVYQKYLYMIGNQTLLSDVINKSVSNKIFEEKINEYKKSKISENLRIAEGAYGKEWTPTSIKKRQEHLCEIALKEWPKG